MDRTSSDAQRELKAWRQRNSDGRNTFEGERTAGPPTWDFVESELPPTATIDTPTEETRMAIRHVHVFDPALSPPTVLWEPTDLPYGSLLAWYDVRDLAYEHGERITYWPDRGRGNHHARAVEGKVPPLYDALEFAVEHPGALARFYQNTTEGLDIDEDWPETASAMMAYYHLAAAEGAGFTYVGKTSALRAIEGDLEADAASLWKFSIVYWDAALTSQDDQDRLYGYLTWQMPPAARDNMMDPDHPYYGGAPTSELS